MSTLDKTKVIQNKQTAGKRNTIMFSNPDITFLNSGSRVLPPSPTGSSAASTPPVRTTRLFIHLLKFTPEEKVCCFTKMRFHGSSFIHDLLTYFAKQNTQCYLFNILNIVYSNNITWSWEITSTEKKPTMQ